MLYFSRWKTFSIWAIVAIGVLFALPNVYPQSWLSAMPDWLPKRQMTLAWTCSGSIAKDRLTANGGHTRDIRTRAATRIGYTGFTGTGNSQAARDQQSSAARRRCQPVAAGCLQVSARGFDRARRAGAGRAAPHLHRGRA